MNGQIIQSFMSNGDGKCDLMNGQIIQSFMSYGDGKCDLMNGQIIQSCRNNTISMKIQQHPDKHNKTGNVAVPDTISMNIQPTLLQTEQNRECSCPGYHLHEDTTNTPTNTTKQGM